MSDGRCEFCGVTGQPGEGCVQGCDSRAAREARLAPPGDVAIDEASVAHALNAHRRHAYREELLAPGGSTMVCVGCKYMLVSHDPMGPPESRDHAAGCQEGVRIAALLAPRLDEAEPALARLAEKAQGFARLQRIIAYIQECEGGPSLLTEAGALADDRNDDVRLELIEAKQELATFMDAAKADQQKFDALKAELEAVRATLRREVTA